MENEIPEAVSRRKQYNKKKKKKNKERNRERSRQVQKGLPRQQRKARKNWTEIDAEHDLKKKK